MAAGDLTTVPAVKAYVPGRDLHNLDDTLIAGMVTAESDAFRVKTDRDIRTPDTTAYTDTSSGDGTAVLLLEQYPVKEITTVTVDGISVLARVTAGDGGWVLDKEMGKLTRDGAIFTRGIDNVVVAYKAGYATVPRDVEQCVIEMVALRFIDRSHIGMGSVSMEGQTQVYNGGGNLAFIRGVVEAYRRRDP